MDRRQGFGSSLFGGGSADVHGSASSISPYLNFDPALLNIDPDSQFILPEGASHRRGRFELAFSQIGGSVCVGAGVGGLTGFYNGFRDTKTAQLAGAVRRTQMLNYITKKGASSAQTLGVVALMYSICGTVLCKVRGADDELNTLAAATLTGFGFKSTTGLKRCLRGGAIGFGLGAIYCIFTSKDHVKRILGIRD